MPLENKEEERKPVIQVHADYTQLDENGKISTSGECEVAIDKDSLTLSPTFGDILAFHLRNIASVEYYTVILRTYLERDF
jgi:hypothetical protein